MNKVFMEKAIFIASQAGNDVPIGAVIVKNEQIIATAHNEKERLKDVTAHAEILALRRAADTLGDWRLNGCDLYVTLEPCPMCAWAILQSRIKTVYFGSYNPKYGAFGSVINLADISDYKPKIYGGIMEKECDEILESFWTKKRSNQRQ